LRHRHAELHDEVGHRDDVEPSGNHNA
jgi:hypothetical protein